LKKKANSKGGGEELSGKRRRGTKTRVNGQLEFITQQAEEQCKLIFIWKGKGESLGTGRKVKTM